MIRRSIFGRLLGSLLLATLLPLIFLQQSLTERFAEEMHAKISSNLGAIGDHKVEQIRTIIARQANNATLLARFPDTLQALNVAERSGGVPGLLSRNARELRKPYLASIEKLAQAPGFYDLLLITAEGEVVLSYLEEADLGTNLLNGPYRNSQLARTVQQSLLALDGGVSDFEWYPPSKGHAAFITAPVLDGARVVGVLAIQIAPDAIRQVLNDKKGLGETGTTMLAQRAGDPPRILTSLDDGGETGLFSDSLPQLSLGQSLPLARALAGENGQGEALDYRQIPVLAAWRYMPGTRWGLVVKMDASEAFAPVSELRTQANLLLLATLVLATAIAFWLGRSIVRPVQGLTKAAAKIAGGNLQERVGISRNDEIGQLAGTFNSMTDSLEYAQRALQEARDNLEEKVVQRTEALEWEKERMRSVVDNVLNGIVSFTEQGVIESFNKSAERIFGYTAAETIGMNIGQLMPEAFSGESRGTPLRYTFAQIKADIGSGREVIAHRKDGTPFPLRISLSESHLGARHMLIASVQDVSEIRRAESTLRLYASVFEHSGEAMLICNSEGRILAVNPAFSDMSGHAAEEILGADPRSMSAEPSDSPLYDEIRTALRSNGFWQGEMRNRRKDGGVYPNWMSVSAVRDTDGTVRNYIISYLDITERKAAEERVAHLAHHDMLTGLLNRLSLTNRLEQALATARREEHRLAVLFIDMDRFKAVNDTLGHAAGDKLLVDVAQRLGEIVRGSDIVARLGGDEFVVVLTEVEGAAAVARVAEKILQSLGKPYAIGGNEVHSTPSIGVAFFPTDGTDSTTLMKNTDTAMYHAKGKGRNNVQFFAPEMNTLASERLRLEHQLDAALAERQFELHYQPRLDVGNGRFVSVEALLRWNHPDEGLLMPDRFIAVAEESGLILPLGEWVIDEACRQLRAWRDHGLHGIGMTVNISARQLYSPTLPAHVARTLERHGLSGADLEVDIREAVLMDNPETSIGRLRELRNLGVRLSIDNFGTSSSSLNYLKQMPIDSLNIDQSLVRDIDAEAGDVAICNATIALAHHLGLRVVAEGVETEAQREFLLGKQCDFMQGYLFGKPGSAAAMLALIERQLH